MTAFSDHLRERRTELRLTQAAAAAELGVSASTLSKWERGESVPSARQFGALAELLAVPPERISAWVDDLTRPSDLDLAVERITALEARSAELETALADLTAGLADLGARCADPVTELSDAHGNSVTLDSTGVTIDASSIRVAGAMFECEAGLARFAGVVTADTVITTNVVASSYTPGAGNIW